MRPGVTTFSGGSVPPSGSGSATVSPVNGWRERRRPRGQPPPQEVSVGCGALDAGTAARSGEGLSGLASRMRSHSPPLRRRCLWCGSGPGGGGPRDREPRCPPERLLNQVRMSAEVTDR